MVFVLHVLRWVCAGRSKGRVVSARGMASSQQRVVAGLTISGSGTYQDRSRC